MDKIRIGISMGDPAGIGPETIVKALALPKVRALCVPLVVGDISVIERALKLCLLPMEAV
jgi:4-hydroxythreonine-4-phosphate dehydrogenase